MLLTVILRVQRGHAPFSQNMVHCSGWKMHFRQKHKHIVYFQKLSHKHISVYFQRSTGVIVYFQYHPSIINCSIFTLATVFLTMYTKFYPYQTNLNNKAIH